MNQKHQERRRLHVWELHLEGYKQLDILDVINLMEPWKSNPVTLKTIKRDIAAMKEIGVQWTALNFPLKQRIINNLWQRTEVIHHLSAKAWETLHVAHEIPEKATLLLCILQMEREQNRLLGLTTTTFRQLQEYEELEQFQAELEKTRTLHQDAKNPPG